MSLPSLTTVRRALTGATLVTALAAGLLSGATGTATAATLPSPTAKSGAYVGGIAVDGATRFGQWRGRPLETIAEFLPGGSWTDIEMPGWIPYYWNQLPNRPQMVMGVPLLPTDAETLATGATGAYNAHFRTLAEHLVANRMGDSVLRLGFEMNGNWFRYAAAGKEAAFIGYWQQIVTTMRSVPGANFDFNFNPTLGAGSWPARPDTMYPGDAYVDSIGLDVYDSMWGNSTATPAERWSNVQNGTYGLDWWATFAAAHGDKPLSFPEWGTYGVADQNGGGGGDNPLFVTNLLAWIAAHHVSFESYFEVRAQDGDHYLEGTAFPQAALTYKSAVTAPSPVPTVSPTVSPTVAPTPLPTVPTSVKVRKPKLIIHAAAVYPRSVMYLQRRQGTTWRTVMSLPAAPGRDAVFKIDTPLGWSSYRVVARAVGQRPSWYSGLMSGRIA